MITPANVILLCTTLATALMAGLFYAWSCSVTVGLAHLSDADYVAAMQAMNKAILNPAFFIIFFSTPLLLPLSTYLHYGPYLSGRFWLLLAATVLYLAGGLGVTVFGNIPLNESLAAFDLSSASAEVVALRRASFEGRWNNLHTIRTVASTLALLLVSMACLTSHRAGVPE